MLSRIVALGALCALGIGGTDAWAGPPKGIGVLGDSYSDEYRFYPPHCSRARNWVEFLAEVRGLNFGAVSDTGRGEPRNQGFAYNWARSAATTSSLIATGQHLGLASQVTSGEVDVVAIFIGGNDFINAAHSANPEAALRNALPVARSNLRLAVETILKASSDVKLVLITVPEVGNLPEFRGQALSSSARSVCGEVQRAYNEEIKSFAVRDGRVAIVDLDRVDRVSRLIAPERIVVGDRYVERTHPDDEPSHFFLSDQRHTGTIAQAMVARMFVDKLNQRWGARIAPIRDEEMLAFAKQVYERTQTSELAEGTSSSAATEGGGR